VPESGARRIQSQFCVAHLPDSGIYGAAFCTYVVGINVAKIPQKVWKKK